MAERTAFDAALAEHEAKRRVHHVGEKDFTRELQKSLRDQLGAWVAKWPDVPNSAVEDMQSGKFRFVLPKPCDLVGGLPPAGRFLAIECKFIRAGQFVVDERMAKQVGTLADIATTSNGLVALAFNFRYEPQRPTPHRVNRAFIVWHPDPGAWAVGTRYTLEFLAAIAVELPRRTGGWTIDRSMVPS